MISKTGESLCVSYLHRLAPKRGAVVVWSMQQSGRAPAEACGIGSVGETREKAQNRLVKWLPSLLAGMLLTAACGPSEPNDVPVTSERTVAASRKECPKRPRRLHRNGVARAANEALREARELYGAKAAKRVQVRSAAIAAVAGPRGRQVRRECGGKVFRRTVVVELFFPAMLASASLSQGTVFVSRLRHRYRVWERAH
jgi:hypothetical protein